MKLPSTFRYRRWILAGMVLLVFSFGALDQTFFGSSLQAQTAKTTAPAPTKPTTTPAAEIDKETGKPIVTTPSGLKYVDLVVGTGAAIKTGDHVVVKYVGKLLDGTKFDASADHGDGTMPYIQGVTG